MAKSDSIETDEGTYGPLQVCHSNAGYYIGRMFTDKEGWIEPGSRESDYFRTEAEATKVLESGGFERDCPENKALYKQEEP